jgi:glycosidase
MQWDDTEHAGFSKTKPWFILNPNHKTINVLKDMGDKDSILNYTKALIAYHQSHEVLRIGSFAPTMEEHPQILAFIRETEKEKLLVMINMDNKIATFKADDYQRMRTQLCNYPTYGPMEKKMIFRPYEARIIALVEQKS